MVQRQETCGNRGVESSPASDTGSPRFTSIQTPWNQQDKPTSQLKILVAEHVKRRHGVCEGMHRLSMKQSEHVTHQSATAAYISPT